MKVGKVPWSAEEGLFTLFLLVQLFLLLQLLILLVELLILLLIQFLILLFIHLYGVLFLLDLDFLFTFWSPHCQSAQPLPRKRTKQ